MTAAPPDPPRYLARYGAMRLVGAFAAPPEYAFSRQVPAIVRTDRGLESAAVLCPAPPQVIAATPAMPTGQLVRAATADDRKRIADLVGIQRTQFDRAAELIREHRLAMQPVEIEQLFGGERIVLYFLAQHRVDFRELVKSLAREFKVRIELRQINEREEAKLLADYGDCGKPVCCNTHMAVMPPVSMRMAKLQKSTLDPTKISGRCGRLKCCLRFEQDVYEEHVAELPEVGSRVVTGVGQGRVLAQEVLARRLLIEFEDGRRLPVGVDEVLTRL